MPEQWPASMPVVQVRVARPTANLAELIRFYHHGIGLEIIDQFHGHEGYSGVMLGLPGHAYHLEFTQHNAGSDCPAPTKDNLLVFYIPDARSIETIVSRLGSMGFNPVEPENPYWAASGVTVEDPDGWRVVFFNHPGI